MPTQYQLREYEVKPGEMEDFIAEWHATVYPLRLRFGFTVVGAWRIAEERFIWILKWEHPTKTFEEAEKAYYDSDERKSISPPPTRHLSHVETRMMNEAFPLA